MRHSFKQDNPVQSAGAFLVGDREGREEDHCVDICGVRIHNLTMNETLARIGRMVARGKPSYVFTPNVDHIVQLQRDTAFRAAYAEAALVVPDGFPLLWAANFLGTPLKERVSGSDLVPSECAVAAERGYRLFFLGGRPGSAETAKKRLERIHPGIRIAGVYCPPYGFEKDAAENARIVEIVRNASPDILFVGLGSPKQELWIHRHYRQLEVPVSIGVGATFEFLAGVVRRAPAAMQHAGLEWLWRLGCEPRRLWKRYLVDDMQFFGLVLRQRLSRS